MLPCGLCCLSVLCCLSACLSVCVSNKTVPSCSCTSSRWAPHQREISRFPKRQWTCSSLPRPRMTSQWPCRYAPPTAVQVSFTDILSTCTFLPTCTFLSIFSVLDLFCSLYYNTPPYAYNRSFALFWLRNRNSWICVRIYHSPCNI